MIRKINKKIAFKASVILSGLLGLAFVGQKGVTTKYSSDVLQSPILSIERVSADGGGGDCSCSSCDVTVYPTPSSSGVTIGFTQP